MNEIIAKTNAGNISLNFEEVNAQLDKMLFAIENTQYTGDLASINKARKEDRAKLSKMAATISDKKKEVKKEYLLPLEAFNSQMDALAAKINSVRDTIDAQVKEFEERAKKEKKEAVLKAYEVLCEEKGITGEEKDALLGKIYDARFENVTASMSSIRNSISESLKNYTTGIETITMSLCEDDIKAEALSRFKNTLQLTESLTYINQETARRAEAKAREEARIAEEKRRLEEEARRKLEAEQRRLEEESRRRIKEERRRIEEEAQRQLEAERRRITEEQKASVSSAPATLVIPVPAPAPASDIVEVHLPDEIADANDNMITVRIESVRWELAKRLLSNARIRFEEVDDAQKRTA